MERTTVRRSDTDRRIFEKELVKLLPKVQTFLLGLTRNREDAEDYANEAAVKALRAWESYEPGTNFKAWLFTIARNVLHTHKRRSWRSVELDPEVAEHTLTTDGDETSQEAAFDWDALLLQLLCLPPDQRDALIAVGYLGLEYEEVGTMLGVALGTVKSRVSRARKALTLLMDEPPPDAGALTLDAFQHATRGVPVQDPYYRIAAAYEELYRDFVPPKRSQASSKLQLVERQKLSRFDEEWNKLIADGALGDSWSMDDLR